MKDTEVAYIGIDVSKEMLNIDAGTFGTWNIANRSAKIRQVLAAVARKSKEDQPLHVCFESTGAYTAALVATCQTGAIAYSVLNPYKVSCFAKATAPAKTDAIDARTIRLYAEVTRPAQAPVVCKERVVLEELLRARETLVSSLVALRSVLDTLTDRAAVMPLRRAIATAEKQIARYDRLMAETVKADANVSGLVDALQEVVGVGMLTAIKVAVWMPELGTLGRRKAAALAGLAPRTRQSGQWRGRAFIGGGRKRVRDALFMPATVAIRHHPEMKALHERLMAAGKPYKVALTAVMRKLICHLDTVAKHDYAARERTMSHT